MISKITSLILCAKAGGGGGSGVTEYPEYLQKIHSHLISDGYDGSSNPVDLIEMSMIDVMNTALGASPFSAEAAWDPTDEVAAMVAAACSFETSVNALAWKDDWVSTIEEADSNIDSVMTTLSFNTVESSLDDEDDITFSAPTLNAPSDISGAWVDPSPAAASEISDSVDAFEAVHDDHLDNDVIPRFKAGMRDIGAVNTSAFALGQAFIEAMGVRDVAKYQGDLRIAAYIQKDQIEGASVAAETPKIADAHILADQIEGEDNRAENIKKGDIQLLNNQLIADNLNSNNKLSMINEQTRLDAVLKSTDRMMINLIQQVEFRKAIAHYIIESNRLKLLAIREQNGTNIAIAEKDAKWDLDVFQHGANMIASIGGGVMQPTDIGSGLSREQSAMGGALSGAAIGTQVSPGYGTAIGAIAGFGIGWFAGGE